MWAQISGHSSVQSSSTLGLRKARQPICILRSKKIEQGQLLYPKICPPIFFKKLPSQASKFPKGCTVQGPPKQSKLGFWFWSRKWSFQGSNQVPYAYKHGQASSYQVSRLTAQNCTVKNPNCTTVNCRGKMVIWQSKVQIFGQHIILKPQTSFDQCLIMILKIWLRNHQRCKSCYIWTAEKVNWNWPGHNFHMDYQKNSIQSSFWRERHFLQLIFILQVQEMLSQKVINFNIIGHFQKSTKRDFKSKAITWDW